MDQIVSALQNFLHFVLLLFVYTTVSIIGLVVLKIIISKALFQKRIKSYLKRKDRAVLSVKIQLSNEQKENAMDDFLRSLHRLIPNDTLFSLEMVSSDQFLHFYMVVPKIQKNIFESQLYAQFPDAEVEDAEDYLAELSGNTAFIQLDFKRTSTFPFKTYHDLDEDLLKNLSAVLSKIDSKEKVYLQLVLKRTGSRFWQRGFSAFYYDLFGKKSESSPTNWKLSQDLYMGKLRLAYSSGNQTISEAKLKSLIGLFKTVKGPFNEIKRKTFKFLPEDLKKSFRARLFEKGDYWTTSEITTIYHFPYKGSVVSNVSHTTSKRAPAPDILPFEGTINKEEISFIGETNYRNEKKLFGLKRIDRRRHLYIVGKTGSGKSKLLELLLLSDIQNGEGCCLLDPHGDLADEVLKFVPKERVKDVVYINPIDKDFPIGFNPLEPVSDYQLRQHISTFFIAIFKKLLAFNWNPRMEHVMRYITLALLETPDSNVLGIQRMLSDAGFRQRVIKQIQDPVVKSFWINDFKASDQQFINEAVLPILNKVGQFTANPVVRNMIGQRKNMLDFDQFMNKGKIVIISISKGKLGEENSALLGSMFITKIQQAALSRANIPEEERRDFYFYVDEFQNFATDAFSTILSEARKYHLNLTIAHQYIAQLPDEVKATAFGNVGSIISFAVGGDDAAYLSKEYSPTFTADDLINLNVREMYLKLSVDGKLTTPFSARTINVPKPKFDYSREIMDHSRMTYGRNRVAVENEISQWSSAVSSIGISSSEEEGFPEPII